jgi:DNA-binding NarL/FixJ family response regulator
MKVLLVEDNDRMRRCIRWLLEDEGIEVTDLAGAGDLAAQAGASDAVVLDIGVSGAVGDPRTALEQLAAASSTTPTVVFSAYAQPYLRSVARSLGAAAFVDRATEGHLLADVVRNVAAGARAAAVT